MKKSLTPPWVTVGKKVSSIFYSYLGFLCDLVSWWFKFVLLVFAYLYFLNAAFSQEGIQLVDDRGKLIVLTAPAKRIISLAPHLTENIFAIEAGDRLVGVTRFSDYPTEATKIAIVGDSTQINYERIITLNPDLILGWKTGNRMSDIARLEQLGFTVWVSEPSAITDVPRLMRSIGVLVGNKKQAEFAARKFELSIERLREQYAGHKRISVLYQVWQQPLMTVNDKHIISDVISLCGGINIYASVSQLTPTVSIESVIAANPKAIITSGYNDIALWQRYPLVEAVRKGRFYNIHPDLLQRHGPRIAEGAKLMCEYLDKVRLEE